jgi:hypothetical protein
MRHFVILINEKLIGYHNLGYYFAGYHGRKNTLQDTTFPVIVKVGVRLCLRWYLIKYVVSLDI